MRVCGMPLYCATGCMQPTAPNLWPANTAALSGGWTTATQPWCALIRGPPSSCWQQRLQQGQQQSSGCAATQMRAAARASCRRRVGCLGRPGAVYVWKERQLAG